jgi:two-component system, chemotaxis family, sensor kinase Cph1
LGQQLTALQLQLEIVKARVVENSKAHEQIEQAQVGLRRIESDIDFLAWELRPFTLDDLGLSAALHDYVLRWSTNADIQVEFHSEGLDQLRLAPDVETHLYRIAQEALHNVRKHANASRAGVILECRDHHVVLIVEDDGGGFDHETNLRTGQGLSSMRERAALMAGTLEIESKPQKGTTVFARVPVTFAQASTE